MKEVNKILRSSTEYNSWRAMKERHYLCEK